MSPRRLSFLFVGCGSIGRRHLGNLKRLVRRREVWALRSGARAEEPLDPAWGVHERSRWSQVLGERFDAAFITNPTSLHMPAALKLARRGVPLFIEKPLSDSLAGVAELERLAAKHRLVVLIGCDWRFHPAILWMKQALDEGRIGRILSAYVEQGSYLPLWHPAEDYRRGYSARRDLGGGVVLDSIHELDLLYWFMGAPERVEVPGRREPVLPIETEDCVDIALRFAGGATALVHLDYLQPKPYRAIRLVGSNGTLRWDSRAGVVRLATVEGRRVSETLRKFTWTRDQSYQHELAHFLACLEGREKPRTPLADGVAVLKMALAVKRKLGSRLEERMPA